MLRHRQAIFESKGDKLSSSAESRIRTRDPRHLFASRLNARWQTDWAIEDQAKNLNSTARPYDQRAFSPLGPTVSWLSHLALAIYIFVAVNFDAQAQASDFRIERRQVGNSVRVIVCPFWLLQYLLFINTLRPRQNRRHFADDIFKCIFLNENVWILIKISLKFVPKGSINNYIPALVQIMAWCRAGDKPLFEPMMA